MLTTMTAATTTSTTLLKLSAAGLSTLNQARALDTLTRGPLTLSALAAALGVSTATMTAVADLFEELGLAQRTPVKGDRRTWELVITENGRALFRTS